MAYVAVLGGLVTALCWGTADYMSRRQSEKVGYYSTVVYSHLATLFVLLAVLPFLGQGLAFPVIPIVVLLAAGILNFIAFIFLYRAFHKGVVSVVAPVAYTYPAVTTVLSIAILGTYLAPARLLAIAGIIAGVLLLSTKFSELRAFLGGSGRPGLTTGLFSAIFSSVFFGSVYIGIGYAAPSVNIVVPALVLRSVATVVGFALAPVLHRSVRPTRSNFSNTIIMMGLLEAAGFLSFTYAISTVGNALPVVAALSGMGGGVAATYALVFLKERLEWNQFLGVLISMAGVFTLLYLGA